MIVLNFPTVSIGRGWVSELPKNVIHRARRRKSIRADCRNRIAMIYTLPAATDLEGHANIVHSHKLNTGTFPGTILLALLHADLSLSLLPIGMKRCFCFQYMSVGCVRLQRTLLTEQRQLLRLHLLYNAAIGVSRQVFVDLWQCYQKILRRNGV